MHITPSVCSCCHHRGFCWLLLLLLVLLGCLSALLLWLLLALRLHKQERTSRNTVELRKFRLSEVGVSTDTLSTCSSLGCSQLQLVMLRRHPRVVSGREGSQTTHDRPQVTSKQ